VKVQRSTTCMLSCVAHILSLPESSSCSILPATC
jgi:hypothetical protein